MMISDDPNIASPLPSAALRDYRAEVERYTPLTDEQTRLLFQKIAASKNPQEQKKRRSEIFEAYLSFVIDIAESFTEIELILVDYIQEGNLALWSAIREYDYHSPTSFLEFCLPRIQHAITLYIEENPLPETMGLQILPQEKRPQDEDENDNE
jgi:DNA-directed RNA polymerase sigma subunit (sigma70/sigma32)